MLRQIEIPLNKKSTLKPYTRNIFSIYFLLYIYIYIFYIFSCALHFKKFFISFFMYVISKKIFPHFIFCNSNMNSDMKNMKRRSPRIMRWTLTRLPSLQNILCFSVSFFLNLQILLGNISRLSWIGFLRDELSFFKHSSGQQAPSNPRTWSDAQKSSSLSLKCWSVACQISRTEGFWVQRRCTRRDSGI